MADEDMTDEQRAAMMMFGELVRGIVAEQEEEEEEDDRIKCPVCNQYHVPSENHNPEKKEEWCSHKCLMVYAGQQCPICLEDPAGPPMVAMPCGHLVCTNDFKELGGYIGERPEPEEQPARRRRRQNNDEDRPRMDASRFMGMMRMMGMGVGMPPFGFGPDYDEDEDEDYDDDDYDDDDDDESMPELERVGGGAANNDSDNDSMPPLEAVRGRRQESSDDSMPPLESRGGGNAAASNSNNNNAAADDEDDDDDESLPPLARRAVEDDSSDEEDDDDASIPPLLPRAESDSSSDEEEESLPPLMARGSGAGQVTDDEDDDSDDESIPPLLQGTAESSSDEEDDDSDNCPALRRSNVDSDEDDDEAPPSMAVQDSDDDSVPPALSRRMVDDDSDEEGIPPLERRAGAGVESDDSDESADEEEEMEQEQEEEEEEEIPYPDLERIRGAKSAPKVLTLEDYKELPEAQRDLGKGGAWLLIPSDYNEDYCSLVYTNLDKCVHVGLFARDSRLIETEDVGVLVCSPKKKNASESVVWDVNLERSEQLFEIPTNAQVVAKGEGGGIYTLTPTGGNKELSMFDADNASGALMKTLPESSYIITDPAGGVWIHVRRGNDEEWNPGLHYFADHFAMIISAIDADAKCSPGNAGGVFVVTNVDGQMHVSNVSLEDDARPSTVPCAASKDLRVVPKDADGEGDGGMYVHCRYENRWKLCLLEKSGRFKDICDCPKDAKVVSDGKGGAWIMKRTGASHQMRMLVSVSKSGVARDHGLAIPPGSKIAGQ